MNQPFERVVGTVKDSLKDSLLWRFSTAWYGTVRFVYGSPLVGFPLGTVPGTFLVQPRPGFQAIRTVTKT